MKKILLILIASLFLFGCSKHVIRYSLPKSDITFSRQYTLAIKTFKDERPEQEHIGKTGGFLKFASKDSHFKKSVVQTLKENFKREFAKVGLNAVYYEKKQSQNYDYTLSGSVLHYQTILKLPKSSAVPYLSTLTSVWTKDQFIIAVQIKIQLKNNKTNKISLDKTYTFTQDKKLPTGLFSLARYSRGFNYKLKLLDKALGSVVEDIRNDVLATIKKNT